jgi:hypothetical protein
MKMTKSQSVRDEDYDLVVMKMTADANVLSERYDTTVNTEHPSHGTVEIGITEGAEGPSLHEYKRHMEPSFGKHCSASFPEVDLSALEWFTK